MKQTLESLAFLMNKDLYSEFTRLQKITNQNERGREFETLIFQLFFDHGFEVQRNPRTARPRQTDLFAKHRDKAFLIETKWVSRPIGSPEIDSLRSRLDRVPSDIIGCFVSMSDYAGSALTEAVRDRKREILLISPAELDALLSQKRNLHELISIKREHFREQGQVWLAEQHTKPRRGKKPELPPSEEFLEDGRTPKTSFSFHTHSTTMFTTEILSFKLGGTPGETGVTLQLTPWLNTFDELSEFFSYLTRAVSLSGGGSFVMHNPGVPPLSWHGVGLASFMRELELTNARYAAALPGHKHKTETFSYLAPCLGGFLLFEGHQYLHRGGLGEIEITLYLPGIPVDLDPFIRLCSKTGSRFATFNPTQNFGTFQSVMQERTPLKKPMPLEVIGRVIQHREDEDEDERLSVSGIVARNPFFSKPALVEQTFKDQLLFQDLDLSEVLICYLMDWLGPTDVAHQYFLLEITSTWMGSRHVLRPVCTWDKIINEPARPGEGFSMRDSLAEVFPSKKPSRRRGKT